MRHTALVVVAPGDQRLVQSWRMPVVHHRPLSLGPRFRTLYPGWTQTKTRLEAHPGHRLTATTASSGRVRELAVGQKVKVASVDHTMAPGDELVVDAHRVRGADEHVVFNCWHIDIERCWFRSFRVDDDERALASLMVEPGRVWPSAASSGVPLSVVVATTTAQGARMDAGVARGLAMPLLAAEAERVSLEPDGVIVTWDGAVERIAYASLGQPPARRQLDVGIDVALTLTGVTRDGAPVTANRVQLTNRVLAATPAPPSELAAVLRALFPEAWQVEQAVREQVALLDVDALPTPPLPSSYRPGSSSRGSPS